MLDPVQLPILMKAVDFVFDEGRKILEERRERRKQSEASPVKSEVPEPEKAITPVVIQQQAEIKQDLLASKIDEILWQNYGWEVESLVKQLETHSRNYYHTKEQYAKWGSDLVPPIIVNRLKDAENSMIETIKRLEIILSKVYKKEINTIE